MHADEIDTDVGLVGRLLARCPGRRRHVGAGRGFALSKALIQLPYYHQTNPVLAASARYVIGEVLADLRRAG
jgi:hypothetical protein